MEKSFFVHESSFVDDEVSIGPGTKIWHFCHIAGPSSIGSKCSIGQNVFVAPRVKIGNNVKIQNNVSVYEGVELEDDVFCGPSMVFTNVLTPRSAFPRNQSKDYAPTLVKRGASIGANATIVCGNTIGERALVGAGAVVTRNVLPYTLVVGNPARFKAYVCECGEVLRGAAETLTCGECNRSYAKSGDAIRIGSMR